MGPPSNPSEIVPEDNLFARAQAGDQAAWEVLFQECYPKVQRAVRRRIGHGRMRRYVDSTDIASAVFGELAEKASRLRFETVEDVKVFLIDAAHKRVIDEHRRHTAKKRDAGRDLAMGDAAEDAWAISSGEPTPSQHAVANETEQLLREAPVDDEGRRVLALRGLHYKNDEISDLIGWPLRKVQRFLEKLRPTFLNVP